MTHASTFRVATAAAVLPMLALAACGDEKTGTTDTADTVLVTDGVVLDTRSDTDSAGTCDPVYQTGCAATDNCTYVAAETSPRCFPKGPVPPTEACATNNRCELGICLSINRTADLCYQFCYGDDDCDGGRCLGLAGAPYKVCRIPGIYEICDLVAQGCTDDEAAERSCYAVLGEDTPICLPTGTVEAGGACTSAGACREGYACVNNTCRAVCDLSAQQPCGALATCRDLAHGAGFCEPN